MLRIMDVDRVVIESRQRPHHAGHHRHGMGVVIEAAEEILEPLMDHGVVVDGFLELVQFDLGWKLAAQQQIADFQKRAFFRQLVDRVATILENTLITIDVGDVAGATRGRHEARVIREDLVIAIQRSYFDGWRSDPAFAYRQIGALATDGILKNKFFFGH